MALKEAGIQLPNGLLDVFELPVTWGDILAQYVKVYGNVMLVSPEGRLIARRTYELTDGLTYTLRTNSALMAVHSSATGYISAPVLLLFPFLHSQPSWFLSGQVCCSGFCQCRSSSNDELDGATSEDGRTRHSPTQNTCVPLALLLMKRRTSVIHPTQRFDK
jgi:hypothetical protein